MMLNREKQRPAAILSALAAPLTLIAATIGLLAPDFYAPYLATLELNIGAYAQDTIAIVVVLIMAPAILAARRGSLRALLIWSGCLGYLIYGYLLYTFDGLYTPLYPLYLAVLGLTIYALISLLAQLDGRAIARTVGPGLPVRAIAAVLAVPLILLPRWLAFVAEGIAAGQAVTLNEVLVIDLAFLIPACVLTAVLVWRRRPWGIIFAGPLLVHIVTLGWSLSLGTLWFYFLGRPVDGLQLVVYLSLALVGGWVLAAYLRHIGQPVQYSGAGAAQPTD
ncbi:MAG: hypothetical protein R3300_22445 [Candidatus Promineifilaceae bacterium]|nr:hypothetical protein [Candidatus Promineifilaceae bacterium]